MLQFLIHRTCTSYEISGLRIPVDALHVDFQRVFAKPHRRLLVDLAADGEAWRVCTKYIM